MARAAIAPFRLNGSKQPEAVTSPLQPFTATENTYLNAHKKALQRERSLFQSINRNATAQNNRILHSPQRRQSLFTTLRIQIARPRTRMKARCLFTTLITQNINVDRKNKLCKNAPFAACISTACKKSRVAQSWRKVKNKSCNATHSDTALTPLWTPNPSGMTSSATFFVQCQ